MSITTEDVVERMICVTGGAQMSCLFGETNPELSSSQSPMKGGTIFRKRCSGFAYDLVGTTGGDRLKIGDLVDAVWRN